MKRQLFIFILISLSFFNITYPQIKNYFVYTSLRSGDGVEIYKLDPVSGKLAIIETQKVTDAPASMTFDHSRNTLLVCQRSAKTVAEFEIDKKTGLLKLVNTTPILDNAMYLSTDNTDKYMFAAYYGASKAAVYPINSKSVVEKTPIQIDSTGFKTPHCILTDRTNKYLFLSDKDADIIAQYKFDISTGKMIPNNPAVINTPKGSGPRHFIFNKKGDIVYCVSEYANTVIAYRLNLKTGTLAPFQTISMLPESFKEKSTAADIHITPDNRFLYASNRGHNSIVGYSIDKKSGELKLIGYFPSGKNPRSFNIDPTGNYLIAAGELSDELISYKIDQKTGKLSTVQTIPTGKQPSWVLIAGY